MRLISREMQEQTGAGADELESISSLPIQLEGVVAAATFKEMQDGGFKVSLRTNGRLHGGKICAHFGGGGHAMAAGCSMDLPFEQAEREMAAYLSEQWESIK